MAKAELILDGLPEIRVWLQQLPDSLAAESHALIQREAEAAQAEISTAYQSEHLSTGLQLRDQSHGAVTQFLLLNVLLEALWWEYGTEARHTLMGAYRGRERPHPTFHPVVNRHKRVIYDGLVAMTQRQGLEVNAAELV